MAGLVVTGSVVLGPSGGSLEPSTLAEYLDSLGVTWYGGFRRGLLQYSVSTDQLTPANNVGESVGQWCASWTAGGFSAKFVQTNNSKRPANESVYGTTGIRGDASSVWLNLDSTSALNRDHTVLIATTMPVLSGARTYSHNTNRMGIVSASSGTTLPTVYANNVGSQASSPVMEVTYYDATASRYRIGWRSSGTSHYDNAPNLFRSSAASNYSEAVITEVWMIGSHLTNDQILRCLPFLVQ